MNEDVRETIHSLEYDEYYDSLNEKTKAKYDYVEMIIKTQYVVNKKIETLSFMESKRVLFLNSFLKKSTKQYKSEIEIARQILKKYI